MRKVTITSVQPSVGVGRCELCQEELATRLLLMENLHEHRFCERCFRHFQEVVADAADAEGAA